MLQYLDFSNVDVAGQIEALRQRSLLTDQQPRRGDRAFGAVSPLPPGGGDPQKPKRPAGVSLHPADGCPGLRSRRGGGEEILLQGVVDCCFETAAGLTVVDFKTDRVRTPEEIAERTQHYRPQLEAYSRALERVRAMETENLRKTRTSAGRKL